MYPSSSSAAMSLRTVAGETRRWCRSTSVLLPTGSRVETKSSTMARSTSSLRSSTFTNHLLALQFRDCQVYVAASPNDRGDPAVRADLHRPVGVPRQGRGTCLVGL